MREHKKAFSDCVKRTRATSPLAQYTWSKKWRPPLRK